MITAPLKSWMRRRNFTEERTIVCHESISTDQCAENDVRDFSCQSVGRGRMIFASLGGIAPGTTRSLKGSDAIGVTRGGYGRLSFLWRAGRPPNSKLAEIAVCSCVSITLPASSKTRITAGCERLKNFALSPTPQTSTRHINVTLILLT